MSCVIAAQGTPSEKMVDGQRKNVIPFVGADREGEFAQMGVGFMDAEDHTGSIWGLVCPHVLLQSWRGMKMLEHMELIYPSTLSACWTVMRRDLNGSDKERMNEIARQVGGMEKAETLREELLASAPTTEELNTMIAVLHGKGVEVDSWELEEEVKAGVITTSPLIETIAREAEESRQAYEQKEEEINRSIPRDESLGAFFEDLGIGDFILGPAIGGYGIDWGYIKLEELDATAKRDSLGKYATEHHLEHTTQGPETMALQVAPGVTMMNTSFGEIEQPYFVATNGTKYTFVSAKWVDGRFYIRTLIDQPQMEGSFTIEQLRSMIGPLPSKTQPRHTLIGRIAALFR